MSSAWSARHSSRGKVSTCCAPKAANYAPRNAASPVCWCNWPALCPVPCPSRSGLLRCLSKTTGACGNGRRFPASWARCSCVTAGSAPEPIPPAIGRFRCRSMKAHRKKKHSSPPSIQRKSCSQFLDHVFRHGRNLAQGTTVDERLRGRFQDLKAIERIQDPGAQNDHAVVFKQRDGIARGHAPRQVFAVSELQPKRN